MGLFLPGWNTENSQKAIRWIEKHASDTDELKQAALKGRDMSVRAAAVERINQQSALEELTLNYCKLAVPKLTGADTLARLIENPESFFAETDAREGRERFEADLDGLLTGEALDRCYPVHYQGDKKEMVQCAWERLKVIADAGVFARIFQIKQTFYLPDCIYEEAVEAYAAAGFGTFKDIVSNPANGAQFRQSALNRINDQDFLLKYADQALSKDPADWLAAAAAQKITAPATRRAFCERYDVESLHGWELFESKEDSDCDWEIRDKTYYYRCKYCGKEKAEHGRLRLGDSAR